MSREMKRKRAWATSLYFKKLGRNLPKTRKEHTLLCPVHPPEFHWLVLYATWIWPKPDHKKKSMDRFISETLNAYAPWLETNFMSLNTRGMAALMSKKPQKYWTDTTDEDLSKLAKHYGFLG